jgi:hypothetical protein
MFCFCICFILLLHGPVFLTRYTSSGGLFLHGYADADWQEAQWIERVLSDTASV